VFGICCYLLFVICFLLFAFCYLLFAFCYLLFAICYLVFLAFSKSLSLSQSLPMNAAKRNKAIFPLNRLMRVLDAKTGLYINGGDGLVAIKTTKNLNQQALHYVHTDHQGSYQVVSNELARVEDRLSLNPYGRRCNPTTDNLLLGTTDLAMGSVSLGCPAIGLVYFTGRFIYDIYAEDQK
jgi:hypothetical protein